MSKYKSWPQSSRSIVSSASEPFEEQSFSLSVTMKASKILVTITFLFISSVTAQTACDPVASAIPTCGVRGPPPPSSLRPLRPYEYQADTSTRYHASPPPPRQQAVVAATTVAAAPAPRPSRPQLKAASSVIAVLLLPFRFRLPARSFVLVLLLQPTNWWSQLLLRRSLIALSRSCGDWWVWLGSVEDQFDTCEALCLLSRPCAICRITVRLTMLCMCYTTAPLRNDDSLASVSSHSFSPCFIPCSVMVSR